MSLNHVARKQELLRTFLQIINIFVLDESRGVHYTCIYVYTCMTRVFIQGIFYYPYFIFCTVLLYDLLSFCFLSDPIPTFKFDEALKT